MSTRKLVRGIGKKTETVTVGYDAEVVQDHENLYLFTGGTAIASATESIHGDRFIVAVKSGENDFVVENRREAVDALEDIGRFYLAVKAGEV